MALGTFELEHLQVRQATVTARSAMLSSGIAAANAARRGRAGRTAGNAALALIGLIAARPPEVAADAPQALAAQVARQVADALAAQVDGLNSWEATNWSPGYDPSLGGVPGGGQPLPGQAGSAYWQAYEAEVGPLRKAAARRWSDAIAATFAVETGLEPPAASFLCANRKRDPSDAGFKALFGSQADSAAERRDLDAIRAKAALSAGEAEAWITGTCRTLHDDTITMRVKLATKAANVPGTFASGEKLGVPSHADDRLQEIDPTALVQAAAIDGVQVMFAPAGWGWGSAPAMWITPFGRKSPRLDGALEPVAHRDGTKTLAVSKLQPLPGLDTPENTIACLMTPVEQATAELKAKRLGGMAGAMWSDHPEEGGRVIADSIRMRKALDICKAAKAAFTGEPAR